MSHFHALVFLICSPFLFWPPSAHFSFFLNEELDPISPRLSKCATVENQGRRQLGETVPVFWLFSSISSLWVRVVQLRSQQLAICGPGVKKSIQSFQDWVRTRPFEAKAGVNLAKLYPSFDYSVRFNACGRVSLPTQHHLSVSSHCLSFSLAHSRTYPLQIRSRQRSCLHTTTASLVEANKRDVGRPRRRCCDILL